MLHYLNQVYNAQVKYIQDHQPGVPLLGDINSPRNKSIVVMTQKRKKPTIEKDKNRSMMCTKLDQIKN